MKNIVVMDKGDLLVDSRGLADGVGNEHRAVIRLIREHKEAIESLDLSTIQMRKF